MILGLYSADNPTEIPGLSAQGFNLFHSYSDLPTGSIALAKVATQMNVWSMGTLPGETGPVTTDDKAAFETLAGYDSVAFWDLPEERDRNDAGLLQILTEYDALVHAAPKRLPTYMYIPGDYSQSDVASYMPLIDMVPAAVYCSYLREPHAWARWRVESTVRAISDGGATVGPDWLHGQKTPLAILELFDSNAPANFKESAAGSYHDFWQSLVSGAQGLLIYDYAYRNETPDVTLAWQALVKATGELTGPEHLDRIMLRGAVLANVKVTVSSGPQTVTVTPYNGTPLAYPAVDFTTRQVGDTVYLIVVNSAETESVTATVSGLPASLTQAQPLFRNETAAISSGSINFTLEPLGVRIVKLTP